MSMKGRTWQSEKYRYGFNGQEKDTDINGEGNHTTAEFWEYSAVIGRRWNIDPVVKFNESPYATFANNPINFIDPSGADTTRFTNSKHLLIIIQDNSKEDPDYGKMVAEAGDWNFVSAKDIASAAKLLKKQYGSQEGLIQSLVIKSHGAASTGPDLSTNSGGTVHNPKNNKSLEYIRSLLSNTANICLTACSIVQGIYPNPNTKETYSPLAKETAENFSSFFLAGTSRNLFLNYTKSTSIGFTNLDNSINENGKPDITKGDPYWFRFDTPLVGKEQQWAGFVWFYYANGKTWIRKENFYQVAVRTNGLFESSGLTISQIRPIHSNYKPSPNEAPSKKGF